MAPRPEDRFAGRAAEAATDQVRLDGGRVDPYDEHSGASASSGRAPSRSVERLSEGLLRVQVVITLPSTRSLGKPNPPPRLLTIERGAANAPTKPCSRSAATEGLPMINERGAQHSTARACQPPCRVRHAKGAIPRSRRGRPMLNLHVSHLGPSETDRHGC